MRGTVVAYRAPPRGRAVHESGGVDVAVLVGELRQVVTIAVTFSRIRLFLKSKALSPNADERAFRGGRVLRNV